MYTYIYVIHPQSAKYSRTYTKLSADYCEICYAFIFSLYHNIILSLSYSILVFQAFKRSWRFWHLKFWTLHVVITVMRVKAVVGFAMFGQRNVHIFLYHQVIVIFEFDCLERTKQRYTRLNFKHIQVRTLFWPCEAFNLVKNTIVECDPQKSRPINNY